MVDGLDRAPRRPRRAVSVAKSPRFIGRAEGLPGFLILQTSIRRPKTVDWPPVGGQTGDKFHVPADGALFHAAMVSAAAGSATGTIIITASAGASRPG
jgi:hypothetical protein